MLCPFHKTLQMLYFIFLGTILMHVNTNRNQVQMAEPTLSTRQNVKLHAANWEERVCCQNDNVFTDVLFFLSSFAGLALTT